LLLRIPKPCRDALARVPKEIERRRNVLRSVFEVRTVLLGKVRLQSGSDLISGPQRRLQCVEAVSRGIGLHRSQVMVRLHVNSTPLPRRKYPNGQFQAAGLRRCSSRVQ
jgi:hypothetical protein